MQHGGGYQNGQSPNNDFSDWVGQDKKFIAVNTNYRLGLLGFFNAQGVLDEGGMANVGLLDARLGIEWVVKNIAAFGGDPNNIAISGQSGGGGMAMNQLALFDGKNPPFQKAIPRSIQRPAAYNVAELVVRLKAVLDCLSRDEVKLGDRSLRLLANHSLETTRFPAL